MSTNNTPTAPAAFIVTVVADFIGLLNVRPAGRMSSRVFRNIGFTVCPDSGCLMITGSDAIGAPISIYADLATSIRPATINAIGDFV